MKWAGRGFVTEGAGRDFGWLEGMATLIVECGCLGCKGCKGSVRCEPLKLVIYGAVSFVWASAKCGTCIILA